MAFTTTENYKIMTIIGWNQFLKADFTSIQNAINYVQQTPAGNIPTADLETQIRAELTRIAQIDVLIDQNVQAALVSADAKTKLQAMNQYFLLLDWGNRSVAKICRILGVHPIGGGYYSQYQTSTPALMFQ